jgi:hypothetical protein
MKLNHQLKTKQNFILDKDTALNYFQERNSVRKNKMPLTLWSVMGILLVNIIEKSFLKHEILKKGGTHDLPQKGGTNDLAMTYLKKEALMT